jgi:glycosyltransferase involved in cell wall biosynthesis
MVGRLAWEKNYFLALDVMQELVEVFPNLRLFVAGVGPQRLELEKELIRRSLSGNVHLLGWVENIPRLMKSSDAFIHLSSVESYGQAIVEACLAQIPVFSSRVGIARDLALLEIPSFTPINFSDPKLISRQIVENFSMKKISSTEINSLLRKENQEFIFKEMESVLLKVLGN